MHKTLIRRIVQKSLLLGGRDLGMGLCLFYFLLLFTSCSRLPNVQGKGEIFLQGVWSQDSLGTQASLQSYTQHVFKFTCDSFYLDFTTHSKVNYYEEDCFNNGIWKEYAKGIYQVRNDTLILVGDFMKANYKQKVSGCYRNGRYLNNFKIRNSSEAQLELENLGNSTEINLNLKEKTTCVQKAL